MELWYPILGMANKEINEWSFGTPLLGMANKEINEWSFGTPHPGPAIYPSR